jgi:hypothetical protein
MNSDSNIPASMKRTPAKANGVAYARPLFTPMNAVDQRTTGMSARRYDFFISATIGFIYKIYKISPILQIPVAMLRTLND